MAYFPFMMDITNKNCLVVGGGRVALRKVQDLLSFGANVTLVSPEICPEILAIVPIEVYIKPFEVKDLEGRFVVIAATDDEILNREISKLCMERNILVNAVDIKDACSFIFPAIVKKDDLVLSISTGGASPAGAAYLKEKVEKAIPQFYEDNMKVLGEHRSEVMAEISTMKERKELYYELLELADKEKRKLTADDVAQAINKSKIEG